MVFSAYFFKERVQPIFLRHRPGHARCVTCHSHGSRSRRRHPAAAFLTVAVDLKTMKVVKTIPVGAVPKRNTSGMLKTE